MDDIELPELIVTHEDHFGNINIQDDEIILTDQAAERIDLVVSPQNQGMAPDDDIIRQGPVVPGAMEPVIDREESEDNVPGNLMPDAVILPEFPQGGQVDENIELDNVELAVVIPMKAPRKRVQKKRGVVWIDEQNQIDKDLMRGNLENYSDTMRCDTPRQDRRSSQTRDVAK